MTLPVYRLHIAFLCQSVHLAVCFCLTLLEILGSCNRFIHKRHGKLVDGLDLGQVVALLAARFLAAAIVGQPSSDGGQQGNGEQAGHAASPSIACRTLKPDMAGLGSGDRTAAPERAKFLGSLNSFIPSSRVAC